ncbi:MAG: 16S rRNA (cytosine(1402)-N(4))-methyltransferase RsmH [Candidatus Pacebacteria bacterium]|nr:16S rRNA (cytosine(1402)-N(4))-methyltransferase RsmH [Candidatus Paceibacterota bacterium]
MSAREEVQQHVPVLLNEVLALLDPRPGDFIIDGTVDGGGHAREILGRITDKGLLLGTDWDEALLAECRARLNGFKNAMLVHGNYAELAGILETQKLPKADGLLIDLGFSSEQLAASGRGFSFEEAHKDEPLLMTYDDSRTPVSAILRETGEKELADIIYELGGERFSRRIAKAIKERERQSKGGKNRDRSAKGHIETSGELAETVRGAVSRGYEHGRIDAATRTFQALRIYANGELENLKKLLASLPEIVKPGGRAAIITFHSLEDRIVKDAFRTMAREKGAVLVTKKPVPASREEIIGNPRSRSAKLRVIQL